MLRMSRPSTFTDQIRDVIKRSGISRYAISKRTGIDQAALCRFMQGQRGLTTDTLDRLAPELDLMVETRTERKTPPGTPGSRGVFVSGETRKLATLARAKRKNQ